VQVFKSDFENIFQKISTWTNIFVKWIFQKYRTKNINFLILNRLQGSQKFLTDLTKLSDLTEKLKLLNTFDFKAEIDDQRKFVNTSAYRMSADGRYSCLDPTCKSRGSFASKYGVIVSCMMIIILYLFLF